MVVVVKMMLTLGVLIIGVGVAGDDGGGVTVMCNAGDSGSKCSGRW